MTTGQASFEGYFVVHATRSSDTFAMTLTLLDEPPTT